MTESNQAGAAEKPVSRYLIGIDLGTTHTALAYADISRGVAGAETRLFEIEQLVAPGEVARKPLLPSFRYHPAQGELAEADLLLPWARPALPGELQTVLVGEWARELSSKVEGRAVSSAKSWLSHPQVERNAPILPWAGVEGVEKVSPVLASASYLSHLRAAWNHEHPQDRLEDQDVVITVPASFDEGARSLTVEAAAMAGLPAIKLLEEPQAVCYDWFARNQHDAARLLDKVRLLMVCDVGGGTTDLSLIQVAEQDGELSLTRVGVGDHLMLGGDNVDLALAHVAEPRVTGEGKRLRAASLSQLIQQTRNAKEKLLSDNAPDSARVTVLGAGARLIGGSRSCELSQQEVRAIALDGFFPEVGFTEQPNKRRSAVVEFGLPFAADPAVSKHLAAFLARHASACRDALGIVSPEQPAVPDAVIFNGGVFNSTPLRQRALAVLTQWRQQPVQELTNAHPDLAVAYGAVAYGMARRGAQLKIGGGSARSFFLMVETGQTAENAPAQGVCLLPKGSEEEQEVSLAERKFALRLGQPVRFHLASCSGDSRFEPGELVTLDDEQFVTLPPLVAALESQPGTQAAVPDASAVEVSLATTLTEVGTLKIECVSLADTRQRWLVEFEIRKDLAQQRQGFGEALPVSLPPRFDEAKAGLLEVFGPSKKNADPKAAKSLRIELEKKLGKRDSWNTDLLRTLFDELLNNSKRRRRSVAHERLWFNLAGYSLRPGFGYPLDDWRIDKIWPLYQQGLQFDKENQSWSDWWTFWRRAAGGLNPQQQQRVYKDIAKYLNPVALRDRKLQAELKHKSYEDMVRLVAALEHLPVVSKQEVGRWLLKRLEKSSESQTSWWALGRIASRIPFHGSVHQVVPKDVAQQWLQRLMKEDWKKNQNAAFAAVMLARMSGDRMRDLEPADRQPLADKLTAMKAPAIWIEMVSEVKELSEAETKRVFGEALPVGLTLIAD